MIRIKDASVCDSCVNYSCSFLRESVIRDDFVKLASETTVCPTQILSEGPSETSLKSGIIDKDSSSKKNCIDCGLCVKNCFKNNLELERFSFPIDSIAFSELTSPQLKAMIASYLGFLFSFAANTNRNKALQFDGFISSYTGINSFIEIDWKNDSLECCRRILGDILTYKTIGSIFSGLIILQNLPQEGSRDIYNVLKKIKNFPTTRDIEIRIISIPILRCLCLFAGSRHYEVGDIAFNPLTENITTYLNRINDLLNNKYTIPLTPITF